MSTSKQKAPIAFLREATRKIQKLEQSVSKYKEIVKEVRLEKRKLKSKKDFDKKQR